MVCRIRRGEVVVQACVFCGNDRWNLELNAEAGVYHCWACRESGRLERFLAQFLGLSLHLPVRVQAQDRRRALGQHEGWRPAHEVPSAIAYLQRRGITPDDVTHYELSVGCARGDDFYGRIIFPVREYWTQEHLGWVGRLYAGPGPKYFSEIERAVVCGYRHPNVTVHVVVEGPLDGIAVHKSGANAAVLLGKPRVEVLSEWVARVPSSHLPIILLDGDAAEQGAALAQALSPIHPKVAAYRLPPKTDPAMLHPHTLTRLWNTIQRQGGMT